MLQSLSLATIPKRETHFRNINHSGNILKQKGFGLDKSYPFPFLKPQTQPFYSGAVIIIEI